jgi:hypothetical protein
MACIVVMSGGEPKTPAFRRFCMHMNVWPDVLALAEAHGWQAGGTAYAWGPREGAASDYKCEEDGKCVSDIDASALANALERAHTRMLAGEIAPGERPSPALFVESFWIDFDDMMQANRALTAEYLGDFVSFVQRGGFRFYWDD